MLARQNKMRERAWYSFLRYLTFGLLPDDMVVAGELLVVREGFSRQEPLDLPGGLLVGVCHPGDLLGNDSRSHLSGFSSPEASPSLSGGDVVTELLVCFPPAELLA